MKLTLHFTPHRTVPERSNRDTKLSHLWVVCIGGLKNCLQQLFQSAGKGKQEIYSEFWLGDPSESSYLETKKELDENIF
jgi:hypothetical protein